MNKKGLVLVLTTAIISGVSIYINKFGVSFSDPNSFAFLKNSLVSLVLTGIMMSYKNRSEISGLNLKKWSLIGLIGLIGGSIPFLLFFKGLTLTSAAQGSFIHKTMFIYVAILALVFLKEKINNYFLFGAALILAGNLLILKKIAFIPNAGDIYVLSATLFWAAENVISKYALKKIKADLVAWGRMFFGSIFIFVYLVISGKFGKIASVDISQIGWIFITSTFLFGYVITWYRGLAKVPVTIAATFLLLGSPITTILNFWGNRSINFQEIASLMLIISGVTVISFLGYGEKIRKKTEVIGA